ncbi:MAG: hypothetical protein HY708_07240 [Ignavibacteriae bacterium]|nr:hypothetical protein [Ignavibacteriota bacterium]
MNLVDFLRKVTVLSVFALAVIACSKDQTPTTTPTQQTGGLQASPSGVVVSQGQTQNVTITGGVNPYVIATPPNASLATAQFVNANLDTAILSITGAVTTATGSTSVRVRDSSTPTQREVTIAITKQP